MSAEGAIARLIFKDIYSKIEDYKDLKNDLNLEISINNNEIERKLKTIREEIINDLYNSYEYECANYDEQKAMENAVLDLISKQEDEIRNQIKSKSKNAQRTLKKYTAIRILRPFIIVAVIIAIISIISVFNGTSNSNNKDLYNQIESLNSTIENQENKLYEYNSYMLECLNNYQSTGNQYYIDEYNSYVNKYNSLQSNYEANVNKYNQLVNEYNEK